MSKITDFHLFTLLILSLFNLNLPILLSIDDIETFSFVYKYSTDHMAYVLTQKIRTYAAVDAKYFHLEENGEIEHFLVVANSHERRTENGTSTENFEMNSIIYKYVNGYFTPFQTILLYDIIQFLPVLVSLYNDVI